MKENDKTKTLWLYGHLGCTYWRPLEDVANPTLMGRLVDVQAVDDGQDSGTIEENCRQAAEYKRGTFIPPGTDLRVHLEGSFNKDTGNAYLDPVIAKIVESLSFKNLREGAKWSPPLEGPPTKYDPGNAYLDPMIAKIAETIYKALAHDPATQLKNLVDGLRVLMPDGVGFVQRENIEVLIAAVDDPRNAHDKYKAWLAAKDKK